MKKILILLFSVCLTLGLSAQSIDQQVISSGGNYAVNADISLSWTLGETVIATFANGDLVLTQGFQQPLFSFTGQVIVIPAGWSGISSWVDPDNPAVVDIFDPVVDNMVILQSPTGQVYWPSEGVDLIGDWTTHLGYTIKMDVESILLFEGPAEGDLMVDLPAGWFTHPVLAADEVATTELYGPLGTDLVIAKEIGGTRIYWPSEGIINLNFVEPGRAYQILMNVEGELDYTGLGGNLLPLASNIELNEFENLTPWNDVQKTGVSHTIAIENTAWDGLPDLNYGDYLAVFTQNGLGAGMMIFKGNESNVAVTAFGDDHTTSTLTEGFIDGEYMSFMLFNPQTGEEFTLKAEFDSSLPNDDIFASNGLSKIVDLTVVATSIDDIYSINDVEIYPNPANDRVTISAIGKISENAMLQVFSIEEGKLVKEERLNDNSIELDISNLAQGVYFVKVTDGDKVIVKKLIKHRNTY